MLSRKTKLVVVHHVSNVLASVLPIRDITQSAHDVGAKVLVDACQSVPYMMVDVQSLHVDFLVASSHKMCGPTGIGFLYNLRLEHQLLEKQLVWEQQLINYLGLVCKPCMIMRWSWVDIYMKGFFQSQIFASIG